MAEADQNPLRIGILGSGRGSTAAAIVDRCRGSVNATVDVIIGNNSHAGIVEVARANRVDFVHLSGMSHPLADDLDRAILDSLSGVEMVILAGYLKKLGPRTLVGFPGRIINTHPALLPRFGGRGM